MSWGRGGLQGRWTPDRKSTRRSQRFGEEVGCDLRLPVVIECDTWNGVEVGWQVLLLGGYVHGQEDHFIHFFQHIYLIVLRFLKGSIVSLTKMAVVQTMMVMASTSAFWPC